MEQCSQLLTVTESYSPAPAKPSKSSPLESDRKMTVPPSGANTPTGFEGKTWTVMDFPPPPTDAESARPGELLTRDSPNPTQSSTSCSPGSAPGRGDLVWITNAYCAVTSGCTNTARNSALSGTFICFRLATALSVHLEAQTEHNARRQSPKSLAPRALQSASPMWSGTASSLTTNSRASASSPSPRISSSSSSKPSFALSANSCSKTP
mmetsp:Transcript_3007/g.6981  ORF Transcript_3007/g.6981 Transcript_3007/m.6981 type:complete len:209 (-) Transcript_3007:157-783(-)